MKQLITNIKNIPGVVGVAMYKDTGTLVAFDFPDAYDKSLLNLLGGKFQPIKEILPEDEGEIVYLCWEFENLLGFYYPVTGGWVNIISSDQIPMPVFSLTMTAVSNKLPKLLETATAVTSEATAQPTPQAAPAPSGETVPPKKLEELEHFFSNYLGPASPVIFKRVAHHMGYTLDNLPAEQLKPLLDAVTAKVPENKKEEAAEKIGAYL